MTFKMIHFPGLIYACQKIDKELKQNLPDWVMTLCKDVTDSEKRSEPGIRANK